MSLLRPPCFVGRVAYDTGARQPEPSRPTSLEPTSSVRPARKTVSPGSSNQTNMGSSLAIQQQFLIEYLLARHRKIEYSRAFCHITNRGSARQDVFLDDDRRPSWRSLCHCQSPIKQTRVSRICNFLMLDCKTWPQSFPCRGEDLRHSHPQAQVDDLGYFCFRDEDPRRQSSAKVLNTTGVLALCGAWRTDCRMHSHIAAW